MYASICLITSNTIRKVHYIYEKFTHTIFAA